MLRAEVLCYLNGEFTSLFFDISAPILPGEPTVRRIALNGEAVEGGTLELDVEYWGGEEGPSEVRWLRVRSDGSESGVTEEDVTKLAEEVFVYRPSAADVGAVIKVQYTPMREDQPDIDEFGGDVARTTCGEVVEVSSAEVAAAPPPADDAPAGEEREDRALPDEAGAA